MVKSIHVAKRDIPGLRQLLSDGNWLVLFYADWCPHSNRLLRTENGEWDKLTSRIGTIHENKRVYDGIIYINSDIVKYMPALFRVRGYPTMFGVVEGMVHEYRETRTATSIIRWMKSLLLNYEA